MAGIGTPTRKLHAYKPLTHVRTLVFHVYYTCSRVCTIHAQTHRRRHRQKSLKRGERGKIVIKLDTITNNKNERIGAK